MYVFCYKSRDKWPFQHITVAFITIYVQNAKYNRSLTLIYRKDICLLHETWETGIPAHNNQKLDMVWETNNNICTAHRLITLNNDLLYPMGDNKR